MNTNTYFRFLCEIMGIATGDAAALFDVNPRTVRRWFSGENAVPFAVIDELEDIWQRFVSVVVQRVLPKLGGAVGVVELPGDPVDGLDNEALDRATTLFATAVGARIELELDSMRRGLGVE